MIKADRGVSVTSAISKPTHGWRLEVRSVGGVDKGGYPNVAIDCYNALYVERFMSSFYGAIGTAELRCGDDSRNTVHDVRDGEVGAIELSPDQAALVRACVKAVTGR